MAKYDVRAKLDQVLSDYSVGEVGAGCDWTLGATGMK